jgi:hypothetical protein
MKTEILTECDSAEDYSWLVGRKVVEANKVGMHIPMTVGHWRSESDGYIILDDGTQVYVKGNEGCGGCDSGNYDLQHLATVDNVITSVRLATETSCYDEYSDEYVSYRIFVYAGAEEINLMQVDGTDGNGYYGTGYEITVIFPDE